MYLLKIFLTLLLSIILILPAYSQTDVLKVQVKIINLTQMDLDKAIKFCNNNNLSCPKIREKAKNLKRKSEEKKT